MSYFTSGEWEGSIKCSCGSATSFVNIGRRLFVICSNCKTYKRIYTNFDRGLEEQTEEQKQAVIKLIKTYEEGILKPQAIDPLK